MKVRLVVAALATLALAACESVYSAPSSGPLAQVAVSNVKLLESQQAKLLYLGPDRSRRDWIGEGIFYEYDRRWPVAAGERTVFELERLTYQGYTELYCSTYYSFTPRPGRAYVFTPDGTSPICSVAITDAETGAAPDDLRQESAP
jgi:hypothetical protein